MPERYLYAIALEDGTGNLLLEDSSGIIALEVPFITFNNFEFVKSVSAGIISVTEKTR